MPVAHVYSSKKDVLVLNGKENMNVRRNFASIRGNAENEWLSSLVRAWMECVPNETLHDKLH